VSTPAAWSIDFVVSAWGTLGDLLSPLVVPITAGITTYVAYQQWVTNRNRLRIELYDRRAAVLRASREFISSIMGPARVDGEALAAFVRGVAEADFLFDRDLVRHLDEIYKKAVRMLTLQLERQETARGVCAQSSSFAEEYAQLLAWMQSQHSVLNDKFKKYLRVP
jgi:hypothetical protein